MNSNSLMRIFYNIISPIYDYFFGSDTRHVQDMRKRIVSRLGLRKGDKVLEIGVGTGANLPHISRRIGRNGRISGIDISEGMLDKCRRNLERWGIRAELSTGNAESLPYEDDSFDAVLFFGSINFISDKRRALAEAVRVARPGARIVVGDETFPVIGTMDKAARLLPKGIAGLKKSRERALVDFWIIDFSKKAGKRRKKQEKVY